MLKLEWNSVCLSSTSSNKAPIKACKYTLIYVIWWVIIDCSAETNFQQHSDSCYLLTPLLLFHLFECIPRLLIKPFKKTTTRSRLQLTLINLSFTVVLAALGFNAASSTNTKQLTSQYMLLFDALGLLQVAALKHCDRNPSLFPSLWSLSSHKICPLHWLLVLIPGNYKHYILNLVFHIIISDLC